MKKTLVYILTEICHERCKWLGPILTFFQYFSLQYLISWKGSNRYCLDKNYAGVLIIWDRMFGTFEWERDDEKIVYGLVDQPQFFNPLKHQVKKII